jgi:hypothetical protein
MTDPAAKNLNRGDTLMTDPTPSWRDLIKVHLAAELFPLMSPEELKALGEDIKANGLTDPVTTWRDKDGTEWLIDGRNRLDAMAAAGYRFKLHGQLSGVGPHKQREPERFKVLPPSEANRWSLSYVSPCFGSDFDPYTYVVSANIRRRHLTTEQRKEIAAELLKANPAQSDRSVAKEVGISPTTVGAIRETVEPSSVQTGQLEQDAPKRVGRDGKARKMPERKSKGATAPAEPVAISEPRPAAEPEDDADDSGLYMGMTNDLKIADWVQSYVDLTKRQRSEGFKILTKVRPGLRDLPFDDAFTTVRDWFAALLITQQTQVLEELAAANDTVDAGAAMGGVEAAARQAEKAAA